MGFNGVLIYAFQQLIRSYVQLTYRLLGCVMTDDAVARIVTAIAKYEAQKIGLPANQKSITFFSSLVDRAKILPMCQFLRDSPSRNPDQVVARFVAFFDDSSWLIEGGG